MYDPMLSNEDLILLAILAAGAIYLNWNTFVRHLGLQKKADRNAPKSAQSSVFSRKSSRTTEEAA
jgi:hypothetical protein